MEHLFEFFDLSKSLFRNLVRYQSMHAGNQHVFIVRAVEDIDLPLERSLLMHAPQEIMSHFFRRRSFEGHDFATLWIHSGHHALYRPVLTTGVHPLQHDQHPAATVGIETFLQLIKLADQLSRHSFRLFFVLIRFLVFTGVVWITRIQSEW